MLLGINFKLKIREIFHYLSIQHNDQAKHTLNLYLKLFSYMFQFK